MACSVIVFTAIAATTSTGQADSTVVPLAHENVVVKTRTDLQTQAAQREERKAQLVQLDEHRMRRANHNKVVRDYLQALYEAEQARLAAEEAARQERARQAAAAKQAQRSSSTATAAAASTPVPAGGNRALGQQMAANRGWTGSQWVCLDELWGNRESGWSHTATNPSSGAYGIPQALPGSKMSSHGADWRTNPATQIAWGLDYIAGRYGTPCGAVAHSDRVGWY